MLTHTPSVIIPLCCSTLSFAQPIIMFSLLSVQIYAASHPYDDHVNREIIHPDPWARNAPVVRLFKLQSLCSQKLVQIIDRHVTAYGTNPMFGKSNHIFVKSQLFYIIFHVLYYMC